MFRLIGLTFWGKSRVDPTVEPKIHESPRSMTMPLILLAIPSVFLGLVCLAGPPLGPLFGIDQQGLATGCAGVRAGDRATLGRSEAPFTARRHRRRLILVSVAVAGAGMLVAWRLFGVELGAAARRRPAERWSEPDRAAPVPVPRVAQQVVVRRHQQPALRP